jgi:hypothetical protein
VEPDNDGPFEETIQFAAVAHSALYNAAARTGMPYQSVVNRAVVLYEMAITAKPGQGVYFPDPTSGRQRNLMVLPAVVKVWGGLIEVTFQVPDGRRKVRLNFRGLRRRIRANREGYRRPDPGDGGQQRPDPGA